MGAARGQPAVSGTSRRGRGIGERDLEPDSDVRTERHRQLDSSGMTLASLCDTALSRNYQRAVATAHLVRGYGKYRVYPSGCLPDPSVTRSSSGEIGAILPG
jgi:hypothetical protein